VFGGRFTSFEALQEPGRPPQWNQWFHFKFLGKDRFTFWNASICTAMDAFWSEARTIAFDRAFSRLTADQINAQMKPRFELLPRTSIKAPKLYQMIDAQPRIEQFDGRTLSEEVDRLEALIIRNEPPEIRESITIDRRFLEGIGLSIIVDEPCIDASVVNASIDRFREIGERDFRSEHCVPRDRLPFVTRTEWYEQWDPRAAAEQSGDNEDQSMP
jgi:hypothetical protein